MKKKHETKEKEINYLRENTNAGSDLSDFLNFVGEIRRISDYELAFCNLNAVGAKEEKEYLAFRFNSNNFAVRSINDLLYWLVQHISSTINGAQSSK